MNPPISLRLPHALGSTMVFLQAVAFQIMQNKKQLLTGVVQLAILSFAIRTAAHFSTHGKVSNVIIPLHLMIIVQQLKLLCTHAHQTAKLALLTLHFLKRHYPPNITPCPLTYIKSILYFSIFKFTFLAML
ncbi:MAG TPA: hypothetical protein V6D03_01290, partial [Candidatus Caenarcaniphilales bacterium]